MAPEGIPAESLGIRLARLAGIGDAGRVLRDFAHSYLPNQALAALAGAAALPVLAHKLHPLDLGVLTIAQTLISLGWVLVGSWLGSAIIRELPRHRLAGDLAAFRRTLSRGLGVAFLALGAYSGLIAAGGALSSAIGRNELLIDAAAAGLLLQNTANSLLAGSLRPRLYLAVDSGARVGGIALGIALVFAGHGVGGYLAGIAIASFVAGLAGLRAGWPQGGHAGASAPLPLSPWLRFGVPSAAAGIATWGLAFADRYILAGLRGASSVGVYSLGNMIGDKAITIPAMAFGTAAGPLLVAAWEKHGRAEVERLMRSYTRILLLMGVPTVLLLAATGQTIVDLIAPKSYSHAGAVVAIVAAGSLIYALALIGYTGLIVGKRTTPMLYGAGIGLVVNVAANFALVPPFGIVGAAVATPLGMAASRSRLEAWSRRFAVWAFPWGTLARCCLAGAAACAAATATGSFSWSPAISLTVACAVFAIVYLAGLMLLGERYAARRIAAA